jgi:hypothetical protein
MGELQGVIQLIHQTTDEIIEISKGLPDPILRWKTSQEAWSIMEVLCHVEEATPYWLNELEQVIASPGIEWGRGLQYEGRLAAVAQADHRKLDLVLGELVESKQKVRSVLGAVKQEDLTIESPSRNPRFGIKPMSFIVDHLLVEHIEKHLNQIKRNLQQYEANFGK